MYVHKYSKFPEFWIWKILIVFYKKTYQCRGEDDGEYIKYFGIFSNCGNFMILDIKGNSIIHETYVLYNARYFL